MEISVIIPTYLPGDYFWECLDSLRNQSLSKEKFEVLIILNGRKEPYMSDIEMYLLKNKLKNFKLFFSNKGVSCARNLGLDKAQGNYIAFIDDDDYISENYLLGMLNSVIKYDKKSICVANYKEFDDESGIKINETKYKDHKIVTQLYRMRKVFFSMGAKLISKSVIKNNRFNMELENGEDTCFMINISKNINRIVVKENAIYYRRVRSSSAHFRKKKISTILYYTIKICIIQSKLLLKKDYSILLILLTEIALIKGALFQIGNSLKRKRK